MSWYMENVGSREDVEAAIDESVSKSGMPASVGAHLKDVVAACAPGEYKALIYVKSTGHRPLNFGSTEICEVRMLKSGVWKPI